MLTNVEKIVHLCMTPFFSSLNHDQLRSIAKECVTQEFSAHDIVFREGDRGDLLYIIVSGQVAIAKGGGVRLATLGPISCFGEMAIFEDAPRSATARAQTDCRMLTLSRRSVLKIGRSFPQVYEAFLQTLSARLRIATEIITD